MGMVDNRGRPSLESFKATPELTPEYIFRFIAVRYHVA